MWSYTTMYIAYIHWLYNILTWRYTCIMWYVCMKIYMYYVIYEHAEKYIKYENRYTWKICMYSVKYVNGDICVLCDIFTSDVHVSCSIFTWIYTWIMLYIHTKIHMKQYMYYVIYLHEETHVWCIIFERSYICIMYTLYCTLCTRFDIPYTSRVYSIWFIIYSI